MADYHPNQRDEIRRKYLIWGPNQPRKLEFPYREIGKKKKKRRFNPDWYDDYAYWLEYSEKEHKAYCLCCYLFRDNIKDNHHGHDAFVVEGFNCWNKTERFVTHVGDRNSFHNRALKDCEDLLKQDQSIPAAWNRQSQTEKNEHLMRLNAAIDVCRYLLHQGQPFRGHDESKDSENKGNYLELMDYTIKQNDVVAKAFKNAPNNNQMLSPKIQRDITECFAKEVLGHVMKEIGNGVFSLLVDECRDVSDKEQMAVVLRYLDKCGLVQEKFVGVVHVEEITSSYLKSCIDLLFSQLGLNLEQVRGQGYDGASNMSGEFNGLQAKIMNENKSAYYVHCFAHKLNLVVVAIAKKIFEVGDFFDMVSVLLNVVGASCKRKDQLREHHQEEVRKAIGCGEIATGTGLNQELSLQRPGDTRWNSHYKTLLGLSKMFSSVVKVLEYVEKDGTDTGKRRQARGLLKYFQTFDSAFFLHMMMMILALTNGLSKTLQRKDKDIVNAISDVESTKRELEKLRTNEGWDSLMRKVYCFCEKHDIPVLDMEDAYVNPKKPRQKTGINNEHYYRVDCFFAVLDLLGEEFNDRFNEVNSELLLCMSALSPSDLFSRFDKAKLLKLAKHYPDDFNHQDMVTLEHELGLYIDNILHDTRFSSLDKIGDLAKLMVDTRKHLSYPLVYRLLKLALTLPVATATVERCFSAMKIVKNALRNKIGDDYLSHSLICFVEKGLLDEITNEVIVDRFHKMKDRRGKNEI
nr:zinc finger MYM-type protein 1 [Aegilops tauschii subsp. strangulata]